MANFVRPWNEKTAAAVVKKSFEWHESRGFCGIRLVVRKRNAPNLRWFNLLGSRFVNSIPIIPPGFWLSRDRGELRSVATSTGERRLVSYLALRYASLGVSGLAIPLPLWTFTIYSLPSLLAD
jgi:hypothetical protein